MKNKIKIFEIAFVVIIIATAIFTYPDNFQITMILVGLFFAIMILFSLFKYKQSGKITNRNE